MGVIQRQTLKNNIFAYAAIAVGAFAQLYIYPQDLELKGHADGILKWAQMILPFLALGTGAIPIRFLPYIKAPFEYASYQLLTRALAVITATICALILANYLGGELLVSVLKVFNLSIDKLENYRWEIIGIVGSFTYASIITAHLANFKRIAIPVVFNSLLPKIGLPLLVMMVVYGWGNKETFTHGLVMLYALGALGLLIYTYSLGWFRLRWGKLNLEGQTVKDMFSVAGFSIIGSLGSVLAVHLDTLSVNTYIGDFDTAIYSFAAFAILVMAVPYKAINSIAAPIVTKSWKDGDMAHLEELYQQSATVLIATGGFIYTGLVVCLPYVYQLTEGTGQLATGYTAALLLGGGVLFDQVTSINNILIGFSDYYRWNVLFVLIMGLMNVALNYLFIKQMNMGIAGAALATMCSLFIFNVTKAVFIKVRMGIHPFAFNQLLTMIVLFAIGLVAWFTPLPEGGYLNVTIRGAIITFLFLIYLRYSDGVPPIRRALKGGVKAMF